MSSLSLLPRTCINTKINQRLMVSFAGLCKKRHLIRNICRADVRSLSAASTSQQHTASLNLPSELGAPLMDLIQKIHANDSKAVVYATGGAVQVGAERG